MPPRISLPSPQFHPPTLKAPFAQGSGDFCKDVEEYVLRVQAFYNSRANWHRRFYRSTGILVILIGASLPVLTSLRYDHKDFVISVAGVVVAALTALRSFYRWDQSWVLLRNTEMTITQAYFKWKVESDNDAEGDEKARKSTRNKAALALLESVTEIRWNEAQSFFKDLTYPTSAEKQ